MGLNYYLTPFEPSKWESQTSDLKIDPKIFEREILKQWPNSEFFPTASSYVLDWRLVTSNGNGYLGGLQEDYQTVSFSYSPPAEFVLWYRSFIADKYHIYLFNSSSWNSLEIKPNTSEEEIRAFTGEIAS